MHAGGGAGANSKNSKKENIFHFHIERESMGYVVASCTFRRSNTSNDCSSSLSPPIESALAKNNSNNGNDNDSVTSNNSNSGSKLTTVAEADIADVGMGSDFIGTGIGATIQEEHEGEEEEERKDKDEDKSKDKSKAEEDSSSSKSDGELGTGTLQLYEEMNRDVIKEVLYSAQVHSIREKKIISNFSQMLFDII